MKNVFEKIGLPDEKGERDEQNKQEKISSLEELNGLIGTEIAEIGNYYGKSAEDWIRNFKEGLSRIEILINSEEAADFLNKSVSESAFMRIRALMDNLDNLDADKLSAKAKDILLKDLNSIL